MTGRYLTDLADVLRRAGLDVVEDPGWPTRARSSGGFPAEGPWCVMWHHTASGRATSPQAEADWMCRNSPDRPVANVVVQRGAGQVWVLAAGCTNTNGKGGPYRLPDGRTVAADSMNARGFGMEIANDGVGEPYDPRQIDAAFGVSLAVAGAYGFRPDNVVSHNAWAPTRKIDPATAAAVGGPWRPRSCTSSGTWNLDDLRAECVRRASAAPGPIPPTPDPEDDDVKLYLVLYPGTTGQFVTDTATFKTPISTPDVAWQGVTALGWLSAVPGQPEPIVLEPGWAPFLDRLPTIGG